MAATDEESDVVYTDAVIDQATEAFFRDFFRTRFGQVLMVACLVNVAAFGLMVWLGVRDHFTLFVIGMIAALGPVYLGVLYFYYPRKLAAALKQSLKPSAKIMISSTGFGISANDRTVKLLWSDVKRILEFPDYYILVFRPALAFTVIPKRGLLTASQQLIRDASTGN